jgi:hypothetical protein
MAFSSIDEALTIFEKHISEIGSDRKYLISLDKLVRTTQLNAISNHEKNYCLKFFISEQPVLSLLEESPIDYKDLNKVFIKEWGIPLSATRGDEGESDAKMYANPYYHILLFFTLYGIRNKNEKITNDSYSLVLYRIWNGRLRKFIPYCDVETMTYVVSTLMNKKFISNKFETPLEMVNKYFVPTIIEKYKNVIMSNSKETKRIFDAGFARIRQIFVSGKVANLKTSQVIYSSGIAPLYYNAKDKNLKYGSVKLSNISDNEMSSATDALSSNVFADQIESVTNYIITNSHPSYQNDIISFINDKTKIKPDQISNILKEIHNHEFKDHIHEILEIVFKRISTSSKNEICSSDFLEDIIKPKLISSKHTTDITQLKEIVDNLLSSLLINKLKPPVNYDSFSDVNKSQFRSLIIYGICYNLQQHICYS